MNKIKAIVVDDESAARNVLTNLLELAHPEIEVVDKCPDIPEAVISIKSKKPDLVFLDVEMPRYSGYEIVKFFDEIDFQIIFVTAYDKYAIKAFEVNAVDYLLKPIERKRLGEAISKVSQNFKQKNDLIDYKKVLVKITEANSQSIELSEAGKKQIVKTRNIISVSAMGSYSKVQLRSGNTIIISKNIGTIEEALKTDDSFYRTHKSWIINMNEVLTIKKSEETIVLKNLQECKLSRFKKGEFENVFNAFSKKVTV